MRVVSVSDRALVRLIPATYHKPPSLRGLVDSDAEMAVLAEIEGLTSARLMTERGRNLHVDRRELAWARRHHDLTIYGQSHVNAAFSYTRTGGNRFNDEGRGAWYCSWHSLTSVAEVAFHRTRELGYIGLYQDRARYIELLADFIGDFPDITDEPGHPALTPDPMVGYPEGQAFARSLQRQGFRGLVYPSVRQPGERCLVAFEPTAVQNVRPGASWEISWDGTPDYSVHGVE
ncbi:RES family NAD+ phosphorylase [Niveispirillum sp. KHB5.9]|uniref:RES family NAD+ phosphorylase n=1 Tax=Niveispirillum sp. KHB5.9 TaxID=3400269 RepID=UPI003A8BF441